MGKHSERVIITGASSGIGLDLARRWAAEGARLVLYLARAGFVAGMILDVDGGYAHGR